MSNNENLAFPIPNSILEPYIKQAVSVAITSALGDGTELIDKAIKAALTIKVNEKGNVSSYTYENKFDLVEVIARNNITEITKEIMKEMALKIKPDIEKQVRILINKSCNNIAKTLVEGLVDSLSASWSIKVNFDKPTD